ncbi:HAMP domain-containing protein, partial [Parabacteroides goldsteinii]
MLQSVSLKIKTKLTYGIGLLFAMIVLLGGLSVQNIYRMSADTQNILADNYNTLLYSRRMLDALERIKTDPVARTEFEKNLNLQKENITEVDENVATTHLVTQYESMKKDMNDVSIQRVRMALNEVMSLNMASIYRKSQVAEHTAHEALLWICILGIICILIAFAFLIRLPRSINTPIRKLTDGIMEIANHNYEKRLDLGKYEEFAAVANSFNRMAERLTEYRKSTLADIIQGKKYIEAIVNSITEPIIGLAGN